jgi:hypothetical protein
VSVALTPEQTTLLLDDVFNTSELTTTATVAPLTQPSVLVPTTEYTVVAAGVTGTALSVLPLLQRKLLAPLAESVVVTFLQINVLVADAPTIGSGFTTTETV